MKHPFPRTTQSVVDTSSFDTHVLKRISDAMERHGLRPIKRGDRGLYHKIIGLIDRLEEKLEVKDGNA